MAHMTANEEERWCDERAAEVALHARDMLVTEVEPVTMPSDPPVARRSFPPPQLPASERRASEAEPPPPASVAPTGTRRTLTRAAVIAFIAGVAALLYTLAR